MSWFSGVIGWFKKLFWNKELEISVIGLQNAGKTTLINVLATNEYDSDTIPTIGFNLRQIQKGKVSLKVWDLGGQPRFRESWEKYCRNCDVIIFVCDAADFGSLETATTQLHQLIAWPSLAGIPLLALGNKNDIEGALNEEEMIDKMQLNIIKDRKVACFSISAKNNNNLETVLKWLTSLPKGKKK